MAKKGPKIQENRPENSVFSKNRFFKKAKKRKKVQITLI